MANSKYNRKSKSNEERQKEIEDISAKALTQIEKYTTSPDDLLEYANFLSNFHNYSANNTALIQEQFRGAVAVASFKDWKDKGYSINKGEKGNQILSYAPITYFNDKNGNRKQLFYATPEEKKLVKNKILPSTSVPHYKIGYVFDVSQTNAPVEDLPKIFPNKQFNFSVNDGNNALYLEKGIKTLAKELNIEVKDMKDSKLGLTELGAAKGAFVQGLSSKGNEKEIVLNSRNTETQTIATTIHELAHTKLHGIDQESSKFDRPTKEFQAELTSYIVCNHYGMDTSEKAIPYIASWTKNGERIEDKQRAIEGVHKTSKEFIEIIDNVISIEKEKEVANNLEKDETSINRENALAPTVVFNWSENNSIPTNEAITLKAADILIKDLNEKAINEGMSGYDKTNFTLNYFINDDEGQYTGRYDIGSENGGLVDHIESHVYHVLQYQDYGTLAQEESYKLLKEEVIPMLKEHTKDNEINSISGMYPKDPEDVRYCDFSGKPFSNLESYYYLDGTILSEDAHKALYTDKEWSAILNDDPEENYWVEEMYDLPKSELTEEEPEPIGDNATYFAYNPMDHSKPEKIGKVSDIISIAANQNESDHTEISKELIRDLALNKDQNKDTFNENMQKYNIMKNPNLYDFQSLNEKNGIEKNENLEDIVKDTLRERMALQNQFQR